MVLAPLAGRRISASRPYAGPLGMSENRVSHATGPMLAATISSAASAPSSKLPRRVLVDRGRQRLDVQRPQQQRRRQFLQAIHEHHDDRAEHRRPQQRQMVSRIVVVWPAPAARALSS